MVMNNAAMPTKCALTIAGSDSGGGAGIQADLKTFAAHGVHGLSALTALTAQHTRGVTAVHLPPEEFLHAQIEACFEDFEIGAVKLGMLANDSIIEVVVEAIQRHRPAHLVLDPVMVATSGAKLLADSALEAMRTRLLPLASLITPNIPEAELLLGHAIADTDAMHSAAVELRALGARAVLLKGGHMSGDGPMVDVYADAHGLRTLTHDRLQLEAHGTGCSLASAVAANLCIGHAMREACSAATDYVHRALVMGYRPGRGAVVVLDHFGAARVQ